MVHAILSQVLGVWYVLKRVTFGCQKMDILKVRCQQWADLVILAQN